MNTSSFYIVGPFTGPWSSLAEKLEGYPERQATFANEVSSVFGRPVFNEYAVGWDNREKFADLQVVSEIRSVEEGAGRAGKSRLHATIPNRDDLDSVPALLSLEGEFCKGLGITQATIHPSSGGGLSETVYLLRKGAFEGAGVSAQAEVTAPWSRNLLTFDGYEAFSEETRVADWTHIVVNELNEKGYEGPINGAVSFALKSLAEDGRLKGMCRQAEHNHFGSAIEKRVSNGRTFFYDSHEPPKDVPIGTVAEYAEFSDRDLLAIVGEVFEERKKAGKPVSIGYEAEGADNLPSYSAGLGRLLSAVEYFEKTPLGTGKLSRKIGQAYVSLKAGERLSGKLQSAWVRAYIAPD